MYTFMYVHVYVNIYIYVYEISSEFFFNPGGSILSIEWETMDFMIDYRHYRSKEKIFYQWIDTTGGQHDW
jgi:hypothetical protein